MNRNRNVAKKYRENKNRELIKALMERSKRQKGDVNGEAK